MREMLMRLDAGYFAYFKLMHANVFTTSVALIIRYLARSCDASVRQHERGRRKEGKKRRCLPFYSLWTTTIFSHAPVSQKLFSKNFHSKLLKTDMQTLVAIANTEEIIILACQDKAVIMAISRGLHGILSTWFDADDVSSLCTRAAAMYLHQARM